MSDCYFKGSVYGGEDVGGLAGFICKSNISDSYSSSNVYGSANLGGLVGYTADSYIMNSYSLSDIVGSRWAIGGLVGINDFNSVFIECYSIGNVKGYWEVGGLIGVCQDNPYRDNSYIYNCYFIGNVSADVDTVGGLAGRITSCDISNCYSVGDVNCNKDHAGVGGLVGIDFGCSNISNCFWNIETQKHGVTKGIGDTATITNTLPLTTAQMQQKSTYTTSPSNWDFINIWAIGENQTYPYLRQTPASDINQDKKVDYFDLAVLAENWLSGIE